MSWSCKDCDESHPGRFAFCPVTGKSRHPTPDCSHCGAATFPGYVCPPCEAAATDVLESAEARIAHAVELRQQAERQCERIRGWWHDAVRRRGHSWEVVVLASGGWVCLATFATEADAWEWGARQLDARMYRDGELIAEGTADSDLRMRWREPGTGEPATAPVAVLQAVIDGLKRRNVPGSIIKHLRRRLP